MNIKKYYQEHKEQAREYMKKYYQDNKERMKEQQKEEML